jgi:hypothetical protein
MDNPTGSRKTWVSTVDPPMEICQNTNYSLFSFMNSGGIVPLKISELVPRTPALQSFSSVAVAGYEAPAFYFFATVKFYFFK